MTPEEKAKRYDEALARARKLQENSNGMILKKWLWNIFPELKESEDEKIKKALISILKSDFEEDTKIFGISGVGEIIAWLEKQGKLPIPKLRDINEVVEPKFHEGDWVIYNNDICQIVKREEGCNILVTQFGVEKEPINERNLSTAKLWDISDAIDGDVLVNGSNIFIFHFINGTRLMGYCHVNTDNGRFYDDIGKNECFCLIDAVINPATKEQRDFLFQKMKEEGYEFDFETKELKKIENDLTEFENALADVCRGWIGEELGWKDYIIKNSLPLLEFAKKQFDEYEQKPAWSEEDERRLNFCLNLLRPKTLFGNTEISNIDNINTKWLRLLKDRIQLPKQWEPSKEQMEAFEHFVRSIGESGYASIYENNTKLLYSLLEQLKKL